MYRILLLKKSLYTINTVQKNLSYSTSFVSKISKSGAGGWRQEEQTGEDCLGKGVKRSRFCLGGAQISVEGLEAFKSFSLEHVHRDIGHGVGHTHGCDTGAHGHALPGGGPGRQAHAALSLRFLSRPVGGVGETRTPPETGAGTD